MSWKLAPSLAAAKAEATRRWPNRKTHLDGTIGDAEHAARKSDHNPDARGIVHALDLTHDPANGVDCDKLSAHLIRQRDKRVRQIIWNRRTVWPPNWSWIAYTGPNKKPHTTHMHVSVHYTPEAENDTSPWWDFNAGYVSKGQYLQNEIHTAVNAGNWARAFTLLNGLNMTDMLTVLDSLDPQEFVDRRAAYAGSVNMPRIEYALYVVQNRSLPAVAPGDLEKTGQVQDAKNFLGSAKPKSGGAAPSSAGSVSPYTGPPLAPMQRRPLPPGYGPLRQPTPQIVAKSNELLKTKHPIGTHITLSIGGKQCLFAVEWHKHPPTDPVPESLKQPHRGISVYVKQ